MTLEAQLKYLQSRQALLDAQDYLSRANRLDAQIALKLARLDQLRARRDQLRRRLQIHTVDESLPDLEALERDVLQDYAALLKLQAEIQARIRLVPDDSQRAVLEMRYLNGAPFFRVAMAIHYDERTVYRLHRAGLRMIAALLARDGLLPPGEESGEKHS